MATIAPSIVTAATHSPDNFHNAYDTGVYYNPRAPVNQQQPPFQPSAHPHPQPPPGKVPHPPTSAPAHHHHSHSAPMTTLPPSTQHPPPPPHLQLPLRKGRQLKSPLYVPAVLRPTERPVRHSPPKDGNSSDGSPPKSAGASSPESARSMFPFLRGAGAEARQWRERRDTGGSLESHLSRPVDDEFEETLGTVTGPPTRDHWKPDLSSPTCSHPTCTTAFSLFTRRHHCRRCGHLFCAAHSPFAVPLDHRARFHPRAPAYRACEDCWREYCVWEAERSRVGSEVGSEENDSVSAEGEDGIADLGATQGEGKPPGVKIGGAKPEGRFGSLSQSFGREWSWSTF